MSEKADGPQRYAIEDLLRVMARLRDPDTGCPWDIEQNFASIAPLTIEETYELIEAVESDDRAHMCEELGDLLLHVSFYAQMASEEGSFTFADVVEQLVAKLIRRHPHVFSENAGEAAPLSAAQVTELWGEIKRAEPGRERNAGVLGGIPPLPALMRAAKMQKRASKVGFDWSEVSEVRAKVEEELEELDAALAEREAPERIESELGDLLFSCVNLARHLNIEPERALRASCRRFSERFAFVERELAASGKEPQSATLAEMDALWESAKRRTDSE